MVGVGFMMFYVFEMFKHFHSHNASQRRHVDPLLLRNAPEVSSIQHQPCNVFFHTIGNCPPYQAGRNVFISVLGPMRATVKIGKISCKTEGDARSWHKICNSNQSNPKLCADLTAGGSSWMLCCTNSWFARSNSSTRLFFQRQGLKTWVFMPWMPPREATELVWVYGFGLVSVVKLCLSTVCRSFFNNLERLRALASVPDDWPSESFKWERIGDRYCIINIGPSFYTTSEDLW